MRFARFRHQVLLAMGLPACWTAPAADVKPPEPPKAPAIGAFDAKSCARDTIPEMVCGMREEGAPRCGPTAASLDTFDARHLHVTQNDGEKHTFRRFVFDGAGTEQYRDELVAESEGGGRDESQCCYSRCTPMVIGQAEPATPGYRVESRCMPHPPNGTSIPSTKDARCAAGVRIEGALRPYLSSTAETCCYAIPRRYEPIRGRAARVDGTARFAEVATGTAWSTAAPATVPTAEARPRLDPHPDVASLATEVRARLAEAWIAAARMEHASIAAFANLSLRLLALGAPPDLVAAAHVAAIDEIEHARLAFQLASAYRGAPVAPGRFDDAAHLTPANDLAELAVETLLDGCLNETVAAFEAELAGETAADPDVAAVLRRIAEDEKRHAQLAWQILAWCLRASERPLLPDLRAALRDADLPAPAAPARPHEPDLAAHGVLSDAALGELRCDVLREVVEPCLAALAA
ncbi:MAG: ferritin-like domain-containing protein [Deltaproteobacteria bacterium]|nr:ferritin-like domain-containing protein [Deltaproteobacteria bacterium]